jgi:hypothetical protein
MNKEHPAKEADHKKEPKRKGRPKKESALKKPFKKSINPEHYFFLRDGRVLKDVIELADTLENINNDIFYHHVNNEKNDFSNWIKDIFENKELSEEIFTIREPRQMQVIILKHLAKNR